MSPEPFVIEWNDYVTVQTRAHRIFSFEKEGLPENVFTSSFGAFRFLEFDVMLFPEFGELLHLCARSFGDDEVNLLLKEPHPEEYYFTHFQKFGALRFRPTQLEMKYAKALSQDPGGSPADALQHATSIAAWYGSSEQWGFWGERDLGIGVAACLNAAMTWPSVEGIRWFTLEEAIRTLVSPNFKDGLIPTDFAMALKQNFSG